MKPFIKLTVLCFFAILLFGCTSEPPEKRFLEFIREVDQQYSELAEIQRSLESSEKDESRLYSRLISLPPEAAAGDELYEKLLENHQNRKNLVELEMQILEQVSESIGNNEKVAGKIENAALREDAEKCLAFIHNKEKLNKTVISAYMDGLAKDLELYEKIKQADSPIASLDRAVKEVNRSYLSIGKAQTNFNRKAIGWVKVMADYKRSIEST